MKLIGTTEAARIIRASGIRMSPELLRVRAKNGHVRIARRAPLRFRLDEVMDYAQRAPQPDARLTGRPRQNLLEKIL